MVECVLYSFKFVYGAVAGACKYGNKHSCVIKAGNFFDYLSGHKLLKHDSAPWSFALFE
jgi:hypothetical protein